MWKLIAAGVLALGLFYAGYHAADSSWKSYLAEQKAEWQASVEKIEAVQDQRTAKDSLALAAYLAKAKELENELEDRSGPAFSGRDADRVRSLWD